MAFLDEVGLRLGISDEIGVFSYRVILLGGRQVVIEGVKRISCFSENRVELEIKGGVLAVEGEKLKITKYGEGEIALSGVISGVAKV